ARERPERRPELPSEEARARFAAARVARLATADAAGRPHLVPIAFAVAGDTIYSAVDAKPKRTRAGARPRGPGGAPRGGAPARALPGPARRGRRPCRRGRALERLGGRCRP